MLPKKECDTQTCIEKLVGIKADCQDLNCHRFYVEDLEGFDIDKLSKLATLQKPSGKQFAKDLISSSAREMLADLEKMMYNVYRLEETFGSLCGTQDYNVSTYVAAAALKITNSIVSNYAQIKVSRLEILSDYTGTTNLVFNDGSGTNSVYEIELQAGVIMPILVDYTTMQRSVIINLSDNTIGLALITTPTSGGCGCSGQRSKSQNSLQYSGLVGSVASSLQYGFRACAAIVCSNDMLICDMVNQVPNMFGLGLFYKVGSKAFSESLLTDRINKFALDNGEEKQTMKAFYADQYRFHMNGTKSAKGVKNVIEQYLRGRRNQDKCIVCDSNLVIGWITG